LGIGKNNFGETICAKLFVAIIHEDLTRQPVDRLPDVI
jgi:hypothetical protein